MVVDKVIAGVVVALATDPAKPLAEATDTEVTVPVPPPVVPTPAGDTFCPDAIIVVATALPV